MANYRPNTKGLIQFTSETASEKGRLGGIKSGIVRRANAESKKRISLYLKLGYIADQLKESEFKSFMTDETGITEADAESLATMFYYRNDKEIMREARKYLKK